MIKIQYVSDLHLEFHNNFNLLKTIMHYDSDILIIAGDLDVSRNIANTIEELISFKDKPVIYVPGNHDYYGNTKYNVDINIFNIINQEYNKDGLFILNNQTIVLNDIAFIGSTGWWDRIPNKTCLNGLNDFARIYDINENNYGTNWGKTSKIFFRQELKKYKNKNKIICISHNGPSHKSIHPKYIDSNINNCFVNEWDDLIKNYNPIAWIHGHTHNTVEYTINNTIVRTNPFGYESLEKNNDFNPYLYLEI